MDEECRSCGACRLSTPEGGTDLEREEMKQLCGKKYIVVDVDTPGRVREMVGKDWIRMLCRGEFLPRHGMKEKA